MSTEKDLIKFCRYYNGENEPPKDFDADKSTLWKIERYWVENSANKSSSLGDNLDEYLDAGLREFSQFDEIPATLKALLFNRFTQYNERVDVEAFKFWYKTYYN